MHLLTNNLEEDESDTDKVNNESRKSNKLPPQKIVKVDSQPMKTKKQENSWGSTICILHVGGSKTIL